MRIKNLLFTLALLVCFSSFGQNNYADGYRQGYKKVKGYIPSDKEIYYTMQIPKELKGLIRNVEDKNYKNGYFEGYANTLPYKKINLRSPADVRNYYKNLDLISKKLSKSSIAIFKLKKKIKKGKISQKLAQSLIDKIRDYKYLLDQNTKLLKL